MLPSNKPPKNTRSNTRFPSKTSMNICDYEGSNYRTDFWEGQGREYEDRVERMAIRKLLPKNGGQRMLEVGAGFGRLTDEYKSYKQVVLLDYSFSQLQYAQEHFGTSSKFVYVAADAYKLPFRPGIFDAASMIRVIHHMSDVPTVMTQVRRVLAPRGVFLLEHANKQNLKAMARYALRRQAWSPYDRTPVEFVELNFDFHPQYIDQTLRGARFHMQRRLPLSFFRINALKKTVPVDVLTGMDSLLQFTGLLVTPSVMIRAEAAGDSPDNTLVNDTDSLFLCPETGTPLIREGDTMFSRQTGLRYAIRDGIYDFKAPIDG
jgi:SAM-dependent methyltransferase